MKQLKFKIFLSVESYDEKTSENDRYYCSSFSKAQIEDLNKDCVEISRPYLLNFPRK